MTLSRDKIIKTARLVKEHRSKASAAKVLGISRGAVNHRMSIYEADPERYSLDPAIEVAMNDVGTNLEPALVWSKTKNKDGASHSVLFKPKPQDEEDFLERVVEAFKAIEPAPQIRSNSKTDQNLLTLYPLADVHLGMLSWGKETGEDYDTNIAVNRLREGMASLVHSSPPSQTAVILNAGDFTHANDDSNATPASKHPLDTDSRHFRTLEIAVQVTIDLIEMALKKHKKVIYRALPGNHDPALPVVLSLALSERYRNEKRVHIEKDPSVFWIYEFGKVMLASHHGDRIKAARVAGFISNEYAPIWGRTVHRFLFTGHLHHHKSEDLDGIRWEQLRAITAKDAYAVSRAFSAQSQMLSITYDSQYGEVARSTISPQAA